MTRTTKNMGGRQDMNETEKTTNKAIATHGDLSGRYSLVLVRLPVHLPGATTYKLCDIGSRRSFWAGAGRC